MRTWMAAVQRAGLSFTLALLASLALSFTVASTLTCNDGTLTIPAMYINDDYCDCTIDGLDEPRTGACLAGRYRCPNIGFLPVNVSGAYVNDGICDCCDGSDESTSAHTAIQCPNTCTDRAQRWMAQQRQSLARYQHGVKQRATLLALVSSIEHQYNQQLLYYRSHLPSLYADYKRAEMTFQSLETPTNYQSLMQAQNQFQSVVNRYQQLQGYLGVKETPRNETSNEIDRRVKQSKFERQQRRKAGETVKWTKKMESAEKQPQQAYDRHKAASALISPLWLALNDQCVSKVWEQRRYDDQGVQIDHYSIRICPLQNVTQTKIDIKTSTAGDSRPVVMGHFEGEVRTSAMLELTKHHEHRQSLYQQLQEKLTSKQRNKMTITEAEHAEFVERQAEFKVESDKFSAEYEALLVEANNGVFDSDNSGSEWEQPVFVLRYVQGEQCYGAGQRQVTVRAQCGPATAIVDLVEDGLCEYQMRLESPAACFTKVSKAWEARLQSLERDWSQLGSSGAVGHEEL